MKFTVAYEKDRMVMIEHTAPTIEYRGETWKRTKFGTWVAIRYIGGGEHSGQMATGEAARIFDMIHEEQTRRETDLPEKAPKKRDTPRKRKTRV